MTPKSSLENQRRFIAEKKAQGLKRLTLWVKPEDVETHQLRSVGDAYDNAMCESFFSTYEAEVTERETVKTKAQAEHAKAQAVKA